MNPVKLSCLFFLISLTISSTWANGGLQLGPPKKPVTLQDVYNTINNTENYQQAQLKAQPNTLVLTMTRLQKQALDNFLSGQPFVATMIGFGFNKEDNDFVQVEIGVNYGPFGMGVSQKRSQQEITQNSLTQVLNQTSNAVFAQAAFRVTNNGNMILRISHGYSQFGNDITTRDNIASLIFQTTNPMTPSLNLQTGLIYYSSEVTESTFQEEVGDIKNSLHLGLGVVAQFL